ncbi:DUF4230 domain-containing protein [Gudongella oleilytica]|uniref:DUF4230 domain-containing protein n=1 Tax=Gudongella oleilytica TaxID=1582259 RepID=UPI002A3722F7|nr:DUF4230 domain-containing protein [Gudongella oleilytica]MDY0257230.1 DUF4230 domain-containing protein [Gudongella oleilytica]
MKKLVGKMILLLLLLIAVVVGTQIISNNTLFQNKTNITSETALIQDKLVELSEWTTLKYEYSNVIVSRTEKSLSLLGITDINYAEAIKLIQYSGYLKAGTDLSKIQMSYDEDSEELSAKIPKSKILDNVVDTNTTKVEDIKGNIFSDYPSQIIFDEINAEKEKLEKEKINQGFLEEADNRVKQLLTSFFVANGYENVVIEFY